MKHHSLHALLAVTATLLTSAPLVHAQLTRVETFDTGPGFFSATHDNHALGNDFDFSATDLTAGASPAGEIGGIFARTSGLSYIADTSLGGSFSRTDDFSFGGELIMTATSNANGSVGLGYFNTGNLGNESVGLNIAEPDPAPNFRVFLMIRDSSGAQLLAPAFILAPNTPITFSLSYDGNPDGSGTLSGLVNGEFRSVTAGPTTGSVFDGFGMGAGYVMGGDPAATMSGFSDNLSYSVVPEPTGVALLLCCTAIFAGRRPRRSHRG